jgi:alpha/beta superfamily hydrolase
MASNETFDFVGPAGRLEAILMWPDAPPVASAVVCHAHPLHGGIMHFKTVFRAAKALQAHGLAVLRFNFRGVGRSEGAHDQGRGEQDDVRAALDEMERRLPGLPQLVGGFSFGSHMAARVGCGHVRVRAILVMGFPLRMMEDTSFLRDCTRPRLFVQGEHDEFASGEVIRWLVAELPAPAEVAVVPGADHFFTGHLDELQQIVDRWAANRPWESR